MSIEVGSVRQWIRDNAKKYDLGEREKFFNAVIDKFGTKRSYVKDMVAMMRRKGEIPANAFTKGSVSKRVLPSQVKGDKPFRMSIDVSEVKKEYDDEGKIADGIKALGTHIIKDNDFRIELGISFDRWKLVSGLPKFVNNKQELKGKRFRGLYWGSVNVIKELKKKIDIL